ncbi:uncharacterized protein GGS22DRAFT_101083 [Annulohypoxylon maeteangense]|uniref:uncharacterized protein n=1 Tax=Annulohypoxylon maeteangense TaxID=1927788 RepID=UPI002007C678|nr:uncharacterized protein GGS22DRAFT_101083 [Annulohypoxylon maeteangense]KAI0879988.1 hypothetical protein GGS22DRAFT_101083 [Annulohypoxylon maeteangense]
MAYGRYIARMTLRGSDADDTFPERHTLLDSPPEPKTQSDAADEVGPVDTTTRPLRRRSRRRSESIEGYEMRDRYWEAMDIIDRDLKGAAKAPAVWDYVYDPVCLPPSGGVKTPAIQRLGNMPIRRAWRRRNSRERPDLGSTRTVEAAMLYERGMMLSQSRCTYCQQGHGISPDCVVEEPLDGIEELHDSIGALRLACSNCHYDAQDSQCDAQTSSTGPRLPSRTQTPSQIKRSFASDPIHLEVLDLIDKALKMSNGDGKEDVIARAKQIEAAALEIAKAAHEWGLSIKGKRQQNVDPTNPSS